jgi:hypothetical protein
MTNGLLPRSGFGFPCTGSLVHLSCLRNLRYINGLGNPVCDAAARQLTQHRDFTHNRMVLSVNA